MMKLSEHVRYLNGLQIPADMEAIASSVAALEEALEQIVCCSVLGARTDELADIAYRALSEDEEAVAKPPAPQKEG